MRERPILMSAPMVRALLAGTKSQTRRIVKPQPSEHHWQLLPGYRLNVAEPYETIDGRMCVRFDHVIPQNPHWDKAAHALCPYGAPGGRLWVRETWSVGHGYDGERPSEIPELPFSKRHYAATEDRGGLLWRPSIFMPRWMSRITLEITGVRVELLQNISETDAAAEGLMKLKASGRWVVEQGEQHFGLARHTAVGRYIDLWESIHGESSWSDGPWVWVVEFRKV